MRSIPLFGSVRTNAREILKDPSCIKCGLYKDVISPHMDYTGEGSRKVLIIAEAPGKDEDEQGIQLVGEAGKLLRAYINRNSLNLDTDFWKVNAVNCRPTTKSGANRTPTDNEITYCSPIVTKTIADLKPEFIWLMGNVALQSFYGEDFQKKNLQIGKWRGLCIPDKLTNSYVLPLFHPSYILRNNSDANLESCFRRDIENACRSLDKKPYTHLLESIKVVIDYDEICQLLNRTQNEAKTLYLDFETTGLKPFRTGHKIVSVSLCWDGITGYAFPYMWRDLFDKKELEHIGFLLKTLLEDAKIKKQAHNLKFEDNWAKVILGCGTINWDWDSLLAAHILDTQRFTNLEFQSYVNFGIRSFKRETQEYLDSGGAEFNKVEEAPLKDLLERNARDSLWGFRLVRIQKPEMFKRELPYSFFHQGNIEFSEMQIDGININENHYKKIDEELTERLEKQLKTIESSTESVEFQRVQKRRIDINSSKDLGILFYDILKYPVSSTKKGNYSVNKDSLERIDLPFVKELLNYRKLEKIKGTYLAQYLREVCNDKLHPFFDLTIPLSLRSSSSKPNFQNIPNRDKEAREMCRRGIFPSKGNKILEVDYSGMEVCVCACYNKDPNMVAYITDKSTDMHRDSASDIWLLPKKEITKEIRSEAKSDWVFAQFYGSYYANCAENLWHNCLDLKTTSKVSLKDHLTYKRIMSLDEFREHCQDVENIFWNQRFKVYKQWKEDINEEYRRNGFIENFQGFQFTGYLSYNQISNIPIQSSAFHLLLWTLIKLQKIKAWENWKTKIMGQIHDSIIFDLYPPEQQHIIETVERVGTVLAAKAHPWVIVPLKLEFEITGVDKSWYDKTSIIKEG